MEFWELATRQRGYLDLDSALRSGLTQHEISRLVLNKHWQRPHPGVYRTGSVPPTWEDKARAAALAAGGLSRVMGRSAGRVRGYDGVDRSPIIELTVPVGHGPVPKGVIVHRTRRIDPALTDVVNGIPVSSANQTLLEVAWLIRPDLPVERAVEHAFLRGDSTEGGLRRFLAACGRGVPGVTHLRNVLDERPDGRPARSGFEVIVYDILKEHGVELPVRRPLVKVPPDEVFELDLAYMGEKVDLEAMGRQWHATTTQRRRDAYRRATLQALGWRIVEVWWDQAIHTPADVARRTQDALDAARRGRPT